MASGINRRTIVKAALATAALASINPLSVGASENHKADTIPSFLDPLPAPAERPMLDLDHLPQWLTPMATFFAVSHYGTKKVDASHCRLEIAGLFKSPKSFTLDELKQYRRKEITATLECSGNGSAKTFMGAVGNARWAGVSLGSLLKECGLTNDAVEIVFFGADQKTEKIKEHDYIQNFGRSLSVKDAMRDEIILAYEMNGQPLTPDHGFPLRLIVPGWYGIAWVKWLSRIEAQDRRFMGRFMARDYVTIRGEPMPDGSVIWKETSVTRLNVKSIVASVAKGQNGAVIFGGPAWTDGIPLKSVELKIDNGPWRAAKIEASPEHHAKYAWSLWNYEWKNWTPGEHIVVSRATDASGIVQPSEDEPYIKLKKTYYEANQQYPRRIKL
jgi:DMSO/TMAO reductase YedYZ molybdopterin-dependent catalytic subunit